MAKYKLLNEDTHEIIYTLSEKKKDQLLEKGFHIYGENKMVKQAPGAKRRKAVKKNEGKPAD
jgi:hypothetical protein